MRSVVRRGRRLHILGRDSPKGSLETALLDNGLGLSTSSTSSTYETRTPIKDLTQNIGSVRTLNGQTQNAALVIGLE